MPETVPALQADHAISSANSHQGRLAQAHAAADMRGQRLLGRGT